MTNSPDRADFDPIAFASDDTMRSAFTRSLFLQDDQGSIAEPRSVPRCIYQFWDTEQIPEDVQQCISTWQALESIGFEYRLFSNETARNFISKNFGSRHITAFDNCTHPAMSSDYFRLCLLAIKGGFYIDADDIYGGIDLESLVDGGLLVLSPLCFDLAEEEMTPAFEAAPDEQRAGQRIFYVNNNPLVSPPNHPLILMALEQATENLLVTPASRDIQSLTGPGNLTYCLVLHCLQLQHKENDRDFRVLKRPDDLARSQWALKYRSDLRNWRTWKDDA